MTVGKDGVDTGTRGHGKDAHLRVSARGGEGHFHMNILNGDSPDEDGCHGNGDGRLVSSC